MSELTSAPIPPVGPEDHVRVGNHHDAEDLTEQAFRGAGEGIVVYADLGCPHCTAEWERLTAGAGRLVFRHFPVASKHPRAPTLHAAAEAAGAQGRFFEMVDSLYADRGRVDDPHLWERAERLGLDLERFEADRRSDAVAARVRRDFESGIRAGVTSTPAIFPLPPRTASLSTSAGCKK